MPSRSEPSPKPCKTIEYPSAGATYCHDVYGVYSYGTYGRGSVLEGQEKRSFVAQYETLAEAKAEHPNASWDGDGSQYREVTVPHMAPSWFDPLAAGEVWDEADAY